MTDSPSKFTLPARPRRNRISQSMRSLVGETTLTPADLIYPLFIHEEPSDDEIASMPGCRRWSLDGLLAEIESAAKLGITAFVLFPALSEEKKTPGAEESFNPAGLVPRATEKIKLSFPDLTVITDVALDPYNSDGHDGILSADGEILNDETVSILCRQALCQAEAGADIVAPSDMMDGRIQAIRTALDEKDFVNVAIMSYTAKYASAFYGPFRGALNSAPKSGDKKTYQMDPANRREALREAALDTSEGADILLVKPAGPYLDVVREIRETTHLPIAAYQVSGEYLMIKSAAKDGWLDEKAVILESLLGIRRAGADIILSYFAKDAARLLS